MKSETAHSSTMEYTHLPMNDEVLSISGSYRMKEEKRVFVDDKYVFYLIGSAHMDNACCGNWGCCFAVVKGIVVEWKYKKDPDGNDITRLIPVTDPKERERIMNRINCEEMVQQVIFS